MQSHDEPHGWLAIVGIGPGTPDQMTAKALRTVAASEVVIGNEAYLVQLRPLLAGKEVMRSTMGREVERAQAAVDLARTRRVAIVSGGDAGVYGMAGIVLEVLEHAPADVPVEIVPGVTAANAAASLAGSPLSGDFAVISLSDLLTPRDVIERRLNALLSTGIPVVLYNPRSRGRKGNFSWAVGIARKYLPETTPVALVKNAYRDGEEIRITTLGDVLEHEEFVDMHTTVIIGGEESRIWRRGSDVRGIITPRGYHRKYLY